VVKSGIHTGRLIPVPFELPRRAFSLIRHRERHRTRASEALREMILAGIERRSFPKVSVRTS
jgi:DNA-binding transcriptional LysR family regulator